MKSFFILVFVAMAIVVALTVYKGSAMVCLDADDFESMDHALESEYVLANVGGMNEVNYNRSY